MRKFILFTGLLVLLSQAAGAQSPAVVVTGTVVDETGRPVSNSVIAIDADSSTALRTWSSADGRFRIERVSLGRHELLVVRIGFRPHRSTIEVPSAGMDITVRMERATIVLDTVSVRVTRTGVHGIVSTTGISLLPHDPRPLRGAIVEVLDSPHRTTTGADGRFSVGALGEGAYSLLVRLDRYQSRVVPAYVPAEGGVDISIVLDSTIADWQRREDVELREISRRIREATNPSAFVSMMELAGPEGVTLKQALRVAPSALSRGLIVRDDITCVYIDGDPRPGMTADDILAADVQAVEVYGINAKGGTMVPRRPWLPGTHCGTGTRRGPFDRGEVLGGGRLSRRDMDNWVRVLVVWLKKGSG